MTDAEQQRRDAVAIWRAGVAAVDSVCLTQRQFQSWAKGLSICGHPWIPKPGSRIAVVGAGKAGAGMAEGTCRGLGARWLSRVTGWVNVPADCIPSGDTGSSGHDAADIGGIHLHPARPAGVNEPTDSGVEGTRRILDLVSSLTVDDLCIVLISGGGSALLPAPREGISLADKLQVTRHLMRCGATISELNAVRRQLSSIKGGGLARACRAGLIVTLIISDVIGDPLDVIASGPTVEAASDPEKAIDILRRYRPLESPDHPVPRSVYELLEKQRAVPDPGRSSLPRVHHHVIGNNRTAVCAAARQSEALGYQLAGVSWDQPGIAAECGRDLARKLAELSQTTNSRSGACLISGGESIVPLAAGETFGKGGRNQELALAALAEWCLRTDAEPKPAECVLVSAGTDGEDGPTDAAGAVVDRDMAEQVRAVGADPLSALGSHDSYHFLERFHRLLKTGPTHTNVMDLRVGLAAPAARSPQ